MYKTILSLLIIFNTILYGKSNSEPLSLAKAIKIIKENNREVNIATYEISMAALESKIASSKSYGNITFAHSALRSNDAGNVFGFKVESREASFLDFGFDEFGSPVNTEPKNLNFPDSRTHFQNKISYKLPLYTGGMLSGHSSIARLVKRSKELKKERLVEEKIFETKKTFYDISLLKNFYLNLTLIKKNINHLGRVAGEMVEVGYAKKIDLLEVETKSAKINRLINQVENSSKLAYTYLNFLLGVEIDSIQTLLPTAKSFKITKENLIEKNSDIVMAQLNMDINLENINIAVAPFLPSIGAFAEYGSSDNIAFNDFKSKDGYTIGVQLKWNLFNGLGDKYAYEKAKTAHMKAQEELRLAKDGLFLKYRTIQTNINSTNVEIDSLNKELQLFEEIYKNYLGRYREKLVSINDVLIKYSEQIEKVIELQRIKNRKNKLVFELEKLINANS